MPRKPLNEPAKEAQKPVVYANDPAVDPSDNSHLDIQRISKEDARAKAKGRLIGRVVYPPFREGEGHMYQIADEHERGVLLVHICGNLPLPRWGKRSWILKSSLYLPDGGGPAREKERDEAVTELFAQPYNTEAAGFFFDSVESYEIQSEGLTDSHGQAVEEFEIQFIDGERIDQALFEALGVTQSGIEQYFEAVENWREYEKVNVIIACGECGYAFGPDGSPDDFDVTVYEMDSLKELAKEFVNEGLFGEIPENIRHYLDMDAIAEDLSMDYSETDIAGRHYIYRCG